MPPPGAMVYLDEASICHLADMQLARVARKRRRTLTQAIEGASDEASQTGDKGEVAEPDSDSDSFMKSLCEELRLPPSLTDDAAQPALDAEVEEMRPPDGPDDRSLFDLDAVEDATALGARAPHEDAPPPPPLPPVPKELPRAQPCSAAERSEPVTRVVSKETYEWLFRGDLFRFTYRRPSAKQSAGWQCLCRVPSHQTGKKCTWSLKIQAGEEEITERRLRVWCAAARKTASKEEHLKYRPRSHQCPSAELVAQHGECLSPAEARARLRSNVLGASSSTSGPLALCPPLVGPIPSMSSEGEPHRLRNSSSSTASSSTSSSSASSSD